MSTEATIARQQILDCLAWYCRGIDRLDADAVRRGFHPGADLIDYGPQPLTIELFAEHALTSLASKFSATQHRTSNTLITFTDDDPASGSALVETYVLAFHVQPAEGDAADRLHTFNGRYIDRFTMVDGEWKIASRTLRNDWSKVEPIDETMSGTWPKSGRAGSADPIDG